MDKTINDSVFGALFRQAVIDNFLEELNSLPPDEELAKFYTFSPEHEARMQRLFSREARKKRVHTAVRWSRRAAAVIVIAAAVLFAALMFVPQVRAEVSRTITEWYSQFVRFTSNAPDTKKTNLEPKYIPEGFNEILRDDLEMISAVIYENKEGLLIVFQSSLESGSLSLDNENSIYDTQKIDGVEYHVFTTTVEDGENHLVWAIDGQRYLVSSVLPIDVLFAIAMSIE